MSTREWLSQRWLQLRPNQTYIVTVGLVVVAYVLTAKLGLLSRTYVTAEATAIWPPSGLALVALYWKGLRYWPGVFMGVILASILFEQPLDVSLIIASGNTLEAVFGAYLLKKWVVFGSVFQDLRTFPGLVVAGLLSTPIAATIGTLGLVAYKIIPRESVQFNWLVWLTSDLMGYLLFAPLLLTFLNRDSYLILKGRLIEAGLLLASLYGISILVFTDPAPHLLPFFYIVFPFAIWGTIRFTQLGAACSTLIIMVTAVWATVTRLGPFGRSASTEQTLIQLQFFGLVILGSSLLLAISINTRLAAERALRRQAKELERLDMELKEANKRALNILTGLLDDGAKRRTIEARRSDT